MQRNPPANHLARHALNIACKAGIEARRQVGCAFMAIPATASPTAVDDSQSGLATVLDAVPIPALLPSIAASAA